jgi:uncharacterized membrane protein YdjX (TVP38/TMEM64 family)
MSLPASPRARVARGFLRLFLLLCGLLAGALALRHAHGLDADFIDQAIAGQGMRGQALFLVLAAAAGAAGLPRQVISFAAGYAFGPWLGIALAFAAQMIGCAMDFAWARLLAREWTRAWLAGRLGGRLARLETFLARNPFTATLTVRLIPAGSNVGFTLLAGVSSVRPLPFLAGSALGYLPQTVIFALIGGGARVDGWVQIGLGAGLLTAATALGLYLFRRYRAEAALAGN